MQLTRVGTSLSDQLTVNYGVPQGSILRPAMLSLHMYDLPNAVQFSSVESYVDDTKIFLSFSSKDVDLSLWRETLKTSAMLPSSAAQINCWLILAKPNSLCFEPDSFWRKSGKLVTWVYPFFGQALVPVSSVKYLRIGTELSLNF